MHSLTVIANRRERADLKCKSACSSRLCITAESHNKTLLQSTAGRKCVDFDRGKVKAKLIQGPPTQRTHKAISMHFDYRRRPQQSFSVNVETGSPSTLSNNSVAFNRLIQLLPLFMLPVVRPLPYPSPVRVETRANSESKRPLHRLIR